MPETDSNGLQADPPLLKRRRTGSLDGERRILTILFCDVVGSTCLAENLDPEDWAEIMDAAFDVMIAPVDRYEGTVARLMGDAILAFFGAPTAHEDDPQRALLAGIEILEGLAGFKAEIRRQYGLDFQVRIGINTGEVVVGEVGSESAGEYTAMGDAVNLASRLQQTAPPGTIQVSESTYKHTAHLFDFEPLGITDIRGRATEVATHRLIGLKAEPGTLRGLEGLNSPVIGRGQELAVLDGILDKLIHGRGGVLCLFGESGLGKTRLIGEIKARWQAELERSAGGSLHENLPFWSEARGVSYDRDRPYSVFLPFLRRLTGIEPGEASEVSHQKISAYADTLLEADIPLVARAIQTLLGLEEGASATGDAEALKHQLISIARNNWRQCAVSTPTIAAFDDLHWADDASVEVLQNLLPLTEECPILILCSMRPDRRTPAWQIKLSAETEYPHRYSEIELKPLSHSDSASLVKNLLSISDLPESIQDLILAKAEGNPFFIEEVIRTLMEKEIIVRQEDGSRWTANKEVDQIEIPDNLQSLIIARIDRLPAGERRTLQLASVIGRNFYVRVLERMDPANIAISAQLNTLERMGLVQEFARMPELEHRFVHELTRDAAYQSILRRQQRAYHLQAGQAIEALFPDRLEEEANRLATHFDEARDWQRALRYYRIAAEAAARIFANAEAVNFYDCAIAVAKQMGSSLDELSPMILRRGRILEESSQFSEAIRSYQELEKLAQEEDNKSVEAAALIPQMTIRVTPTSELDKEGARLLGDRILKLAQELDDPNIEAKGLWNMMLLAGNAERDLPAAIEYGEASLRIARAHDMEETLAFTLHDLSRAYHDSSRIEESLDAALEANQLFRSLNQPAMVIDNLALTADIYFQAGELEKSRQTGEEALQLSRKTGSLWGLGYSAFILAPVYLELAEFETAIDLLERSLESWDASNMSEEFSGFVYWVLSWAYGLIGDVEGTMKFTDRFNGLLPSIKEETAKQFFIETTKLAYAFIDYIAGDVQEAMSTLGDIGTLSNWLFQSPPPVPAMVAAITSDITLAARDYPTTLTIVEPAIQYVRKTGARPYMPDLLLNKGEALFRLGKTEEGWQSLNMALVEAQATRSKRAELKCLVRLSRLTALEGDTERAKAFETRARALRELVAESFRDAGLRDTYLRAAPDSRLDSG